jgi:uncharacterized protein (UPF0297 family)
MASKKKTLGVLLHKKALNKKGYSANINNDVGTLHSGDGSDNDL